MLKLWKGKRTAIFKEESRYANKTRCTNLQDLFFKDLCYILTFKFIRSYQSDHKYFILNSSLNEC